MKLDLSKLAIRSDVARKSGSFPERTPLSSVFLLFFRLISEKITKNKDFHPKSLDP